MQPQRIHSILSGSDKDPTALSLRTAAAIAEPFYRFAVQRRNRRFDAGRAAVHALPRPVISVGNLTTGGTGKTPFVIDLAKWLMSEGVRPTVLLRGYKSETGSPSDEEMLIKQALGRGALVIANPDRATAAAQALQHPHPPDVFLLDDGFQHRRIHRDLDLVLIDATVPFGFGHVLPRGLLREPAENLRRADAVLLTRCEQVSLEQLEQRDNDIARLGGCPPVAHIEHAWEGYTDQAGLKIDANAITASRVIAVTGIGQPEPFLETLRLSCSQIAHTELFADHHNYTQDDLVNLFRRARELNVQAVVTTEKDWVKWKRILSDLEPPITVLRPRLNLRWRFGIETIQTLVRNVLK